MEIPQMANKEISLITKLEIHKYLCGVQQAPLPYVEFEIFMIPKWIFEFSANIPRIHTCV